MRNKLFVGLLGIALLLLGTVPASHAAIYCKLRSASGTCLLWSAGSVEADATLYQLGNVNKTPTFLGIDVKPTAYTTNPDMFRWLAVCGNPGSNSWTSPGVNVIDLYAPMQASTMVNPSDVDRNGRAYVSATASLGPEQLASLNTLYGICPNDNWTVIDALPMDMIGTATEYVLISGVCFERSKVQDSCSIDDPGSITWDSASVSFVGNYTCDNIFYEDYTKNLLAKFTYLDSSGVSHTKYIHEVDLENCTVQP